LHDKPTRAPAPDPKPSDAAGIRDELEYEEWLRQREHWQQIKLGLTVHLIGGLLTGIISAILVVTLGLIQKHFQYFP
jgi:tetrahydromethanopterin S-methyltransferase subunit F